MFYLVSSHSLFTGLVLALSSLARDVEPKIIIEIRREPKFLDSSVKDILLPKDHNRIHSHKHKCFYRHLFRFERMKICKTGRSKNTKRQFGINKQKERQFQRRKIARQNRSRYQF